MLSTLSFKFPLIKSSITSLTALILAMALTAACSNKARNTTKQPTKKPSAGEATKQNGNKQDTAPDRGSAEEASTQEDETPDPEIISFDASANAFVFYDKSVKLKTNAESKIVTLTFTGGFQETSGKVKTTATVYQGPKCNDKHGSTVNDKQWKDDLSSEERNFPRASLPAGETDRAEGIAPGISECFKHEYIFQTPETGYAGEPSTVTKVDINTPTSNAKNSDARLGSCKALLAGKTTGHLKLKAKIHADDGKLKIQFWNAADNEPNEEAASEAGLAKMKRALGLKTYSKSQVQEFSRLRYDTDITRGAESSPLASSNGDCFKYLYARQFGVKYKLTKVAGSSPARYVPSSSRLPSGATIAAHKMRLPKSDTDSQPSNKFLSRPSIEVTFPDKKVIIGTKALDQLLKSLDPKIDFAGGSETEDLLTAMKELTKALNMNAE